MDAAVALFIDWVEEQPIPGLIVNKLELESRTPVILIEIPATEGREHLGSVLLYGHLDKQPPMTGWREGLSAWEPVLEGKKLYGRGGADDGYAMFASLTAVRLLTEQGLPHARIVILIEASEESGSPDLPAYVEAYAERIGTPDLVICLDSGCGNYEQLWTTTSLLGLVSGDLTVQILTEGVHSGGASGIVPDSFCIIRNLIERIENAEGEIDLPELIAPIPDDRVEQANVAAEIFLAQRYMKSFLG